MLRVRLSVLAVVFATSTAIAAQPYTELLLAKFAPIKEQVVKAIDVMWPSIPMRSFVPALIEQETCISAKHSFCFNPRAELKTKREYGFGLGQFTRAYTSSGALRFDTWAELRNANAEKLKGWNWDNRYDAEFQVKALLIKLVSIWALLKYPIDTVDDKMAFLAVTYNSGSTFKDRLLCRAASGCDPSKWFGNVELYSNKRKTPVKGYSKSFFDISREYPRNILLIRRPKYVQLMGS